MLLFVSVVLAEPARCFATWSTPVEGCQVRGPVRVEATAGSEAAARKALEKHLAEVLALNATAIRIKSPMLSGEDFGRCAEETDQAYVTCFPEPDLGGKGLCFAGLAASDCWTGDVLDFEAPVVRALDEGRDLLCEAVDTRIVGQGYANTEQRRAVCRARCEAETRVRCPTG